jgi:hypothetical protein
LNFYRIKFGIKPVLVSLPIKYLCHHWYILQNVVIGYLSQQQPNLLVFFCGKQSILVFIYEILVVLKKRYFLHSMGLLVKKHQQRRGRVDKIYDAYSPSRSKICNVPSLSRTYNLLSSTFGASPAGKKVPFAKFISCHQSTVSVSI